MSQYLATDDQYAGKFDPVLWKRIFGHAAPYRPEILGLGVFGVLVAVVDVLFPMVNGWLIDTAVTHGVGSRLWGLIAFAVVLIVIDALSVCAFIILAGRCATGICYDLRRDGFSRLQELSYSYFDVRPVGWLVSRLTSDCNKISSIIPWFMLDMCWGAITIVGIVVAMLYLNWMLALVVLIIVPPLVLATFVFQRKLLDSSRRIRRTNSTITATFAESIMGVRTTKTLVRENENLGEFQEQSSDMLRHSMQNALQSAVYLPLVMTIGSLGVGLALWRGGLAVGIESSTGMTVGALVAFMQYAALFSMPIQEIAARFTELQGGQAAAERIQDLLDTEPQIKDSSEVAEAIARAPAGRASDGGAARIERLEFVDVSFWYKEGEPVLENFNLKIEAGQTIALVGPTGAGKSTIVNLAARFYEPCAGSILVNEDDYRTRGLSWYQSNLGVVLQTPHLFAGSIRENIRYGRLEASDQEVEAAARLVNAHSFIDHLDEGFGFDVGEGGVRLSTGQRQLISLARAVLSDPQVFIMDEATSSVDTETEGLIQDAIDATLRGRIAFVIAHRLSTIRSADIILVIDHGRIIERGTHDELLREGTHYHDLYTRQFVKETIG